MRDADKLIAWVREAADELEKAHAYLDALGVPRSVPGSENECTLAARIAVFTDPDVDPKYAAWAREARNIQGDPLVRID